MKGREMEDRNHRRKEKRGILEIMLGNRGKSKPRMKG